MWVGRNAKNRLNIGKMQLEQPGFYFFCCFYVMPVSQTGGYDLCVRHIHQKMGAGGVSALSGARLWPVDKILGATVRIVGLTNGGATNVLFFLCWYLC